MNNQTLKNLSDIEFPQVLHAKIMRRIMFIKFRSVLILSITFLVINFAFLIHRIWVHVSTAQSFAILTDFLQDFELSGEYIRSLFSVSKELLPVNLIFSALLNGVILYYFISLSVQFKKFLIKSVA